MHNIELCVPRHFMKSKKSITTYDTKSYTTPSGYLSIILVHRRVDGEDYHIGPLSL